MLPLEEDLGATDTDSGGCQVSSANDNGEIHDELQDRREVVVKSPMEVVVKGPMDVVGKSEVVVKAMKPELFEDGCTSESCEIKDELHNTGRWWSNLGELLLSLKL